MKTKRIANIATIIELMGLLCKNADVADIGELLRIGVSAERIDKAKQWIKDSQFAALTAANSAHRSTFVSLSFLANPSASYPMTDLDREKNEVYMRFDDGRVFTFEPGTHKVTSFDTEECDPGWDDPEAVTPSPFDLWLLSEKAGKRAADCLN